MATFKNGINGGFTGKVGSIIAYQLHGKWVMKGMPRLSAKNKKGSASQKACRSAFTKMQNFLSPLIGFIRVGFNLESKLRQMTAHNVAKSYNMLNAQNSDGEIDCSKVRLTFGNLIGAEDAFVTANELGFQFTWINNANTKYIRELDQVMLVAYTAENNEAFYLLSGARRKMEMESLAIPLHLKGSEFHTWISFIADDRESVAMSTYTGSLIF